MKDDMIYVSHIMECIERIEGYTKGLDLQGFLSNRLVMDGVVRNLEIIGEAAKNVSDGYRRKNNDINWNGMAGMRDRAVHSYFSIDYLIVWNIVVFDLPKLKQQVKLLLERK